jgi:hypothetical protein
LAWFHQNCLPTERSEADEENSEAEEGQMTRRSGIALHYQQENFVVICDECQGKRYFGREICTKCHGVGSLVIPLPQPSFYQRRPILARVLLLLAAVAFTILAVSVILPSVPAK